MAVYRRRAAGSVPSVCGRRKESPTAWRTAFGHDSMQLAKLCGPTHSGQRDFVVTTHSGQPGGGGARTSADMKTPDCAAPIRRGLRCEYKTYRNDPSGIPRLRRRDDDSGCVGGGCGRVWRRRIDRRLWRRGRRRGIGPAGMASRLRGWWPAAWGVTRRQGKTSHLANKYAPTQEPRFVWPARVHGGRSCAGIRADFLTTLEQIDNAGTSRS